jgi:hypothetical protein
MEQLEAARRRAPARRRTPARLVQLVSRPGALRREWPELTDAQKRQVFDAYLEKVIVRPVGRGWKNRPVSDRVEAVVRSY